MNFHNIQALLYLIAAICFILSLRGLSSHKTAKRGNFLGILAMLIAVLATMLNPIVVSMPMILVALAIGACFGIIIALKIKMTAMPQLIAAFHSLVGLAAVLIASAAFMAPESFGIGISGHVQFANLLEMALGSAIGAITFTGSVVAFAKLQNLLPGGIRRMWFVKPMNLLLCGLMIASMIGLCISGNGFYFVLLTVLAFLLGIGLILPIGGADMPVVVSMLNSYSGWAASGIGFTLNNHLLIITGALVGASGAILSYIMCKAMNRSLINVIFGGMGTESGAAAEGREELVVRTGSAEDAAYILQNARSVIIVPGYGMAVAGAQHAIKEMYDLLRAGGVQVRFAIHPVAGRMPGHMNVLLAEANIDYDQILELEEINNDFATTDVALVIGANDITNPAAKTDKSSPIYGMPILDVAFAKTVLFVKRSLAPGYSGVENELFGKPNTMMLFGDAKKLIEHLVRALK